MIVSNPPYIAEHEVADLPREVVDWEPHDALVAGPTGHARRSRPSSRDAPEWLDAEAGVLVCELAPHQAGRERARACRRVPRGARCAPTSPAVTAVLVARRLA